MLNLIVPIGFLRDDDVVKEVKVFGDRPNDTASRFYRLGVVAFTE